MKKFVCMLLALVICLSLAAPVFADDNFVPSISYKPDPEIVPVVGEDQGEYMGVIRDADGNVIQYVESGCLRLTPVAHLWDEEEEKDIPDAVKKLLQFVYDSLLDNTMEIPYEKHEEDLDPANMVIRDLFDARFYCEECPKMLEPEGVVLELIFDLGVVPEAQIYVQTYDEATKEWNPIVKTENNGDGTVTCTFEHLCAIEFSMPLTPAQPPVEEPETCNWLIWLLILLAAAALTVIIIVGKNKKKAKV